MSGPVRTSVTGKPGAEKLPGDEILLAAVFDQPAVGMVLCSLAGEWIRVNAKLAAMLGYDSDALTELGFGGIIHAEDLETLNRLMDRLKSDTIEVGEYETRMIRHDGSIMGGHVSISPIKADTGDLTAFLVVIENTWMRSDFRNTARNSRLSEKARRTQEAWLDAIFEYAPVEIAIKDTEGRIVAISGSVAENLERNREDFIGFTTADFLPEDVAAIYMAADREVIETGIPSQQEVVENLDGEIRYSLNAKFPIRDDSNDIIGICSLTSDITELKQSEKALQAAYDNLENLVDERTQELTEQQKLLTDAQKIGHIGSYVFDHMKGRLVSFSDEYARVHGVNREDINGRFGMNVDHLTHPEDWKRVEQAYEQAWMDKDEFTVEYRIVRPDGQIRHILEIGQHKHNSHGEATLVRGIVQDITERVVLDRAKSEFISTVSHELRTPLTSIKGSLGLIRGGVTTDLPQALQSMLEIAYQNSDRLVLLINDILDMEKIEGGKMDYQMAPIDAADLIREAVAVNQGFGEEHNVKFVFDGENDEKAGPTSHSLIVEGDRDRLMQALSNLMSNAAKYSPENGVVELNATANDGFVRISVTDKGPGIPVDFRGRIFDKFTQADSSDTRQRGGTGLGLSITKAIVERHGGTICFESMTADEMGEETGTAFYVDLPMASVE